MPSPVESTANLHVASGLSRGDIASVIFRLNAGRGQSATPMLADTGCLWIRGTLDAQGMLVASSGPRRSGQSQKEGRMKATDLLKQQHDEVKELFEKVESAARTATKRQVFAELAANLVAHDGIERELFYPACEEQMGMTDLLGEALVEHGLVEFSLYQADQALGEDDFEYKLKVLKEALEHPHRGRRERIFPEGEPRVRKGRFGEPGQRAQREVRGAEAGRLSRAPAFEPEAGTARRAQAQP